VVLGRLKQLGPDVVQRRVQLRQQPGLVQEHAAGGVQHDLAAEGRPYPSRELLHQQLVGRTFEAVVDGLRRAAGQRTV